MRLLDTSFLIKYEAELVSDRIGPARAALRSQPTSPVGISMISLGEFAEEFEKYRDVKAFLSRFRVITLSRAIACKAAAMQSRLRQRLGENDAWIAATALTDNAELLGRKRAFTRVPSLNYTPI